MNGLSFSLFFHSTLIICFRLTTAERLRLARKRRGMQLKRWAQREREYNLKRKQGLDDQEEEETTRVNFVPAIMLLEAAARNDIEEVRRLLSLGVSPDSTNEDGLTALHQCCIDDSEEMMKVLVEFGANVNAADSEQWTPLHAAATCGHLHLVKFLIEKEASLLAVNGDGNMPYDICEDETTLSFIENEMAKRGVTQELIDETRGRTEAKMLADLAQLAAEHGDLEFRDKHRATPLHIAAANGYLSVLEFLLDNHCSTEVSDLDLWQPLHAAACWGHLEAVEILAQNGADISAVTRCVDEQSFSWKDRWWINIVAGLEKPLLISLRTQRSKRGWWNWLNKDCALLSQEYEGVEAQAQGPTQSEGPASGTR